MTARSAPLLVALVILIAASGTEALDPPTAPPPRPAGEKVKQKSTAELLVGSWTMVQRNPPFNRPVGITIVFTREGRYSFRFSKPGTGVAIRKGKYALVGKTLRLTDDPDAKVPAPTPRILDIESITEEKLNIVGGPPTARERSVWKRDGGR